MIRLKLSPLQIVVNLSVLLLLVWLLWTYFTDDLSINPIQTLEQRTGKIALILLTLSLACTPINLVFGWRKVLKVRRALGLYAFLYAAGHFLILSGLDYQLDLVLMVTDLASKPYIWVGAAAFLILLPLAVTSFQWWMKRMGKNWKHLHRLVYLAGILVIAHYAWAKKGSLASLSGDILQPLLFGVLLLLLFIVRIPAVQRRVTLIRQNLVGKWDRLVQRRRDIGLQH